MRLALLVFLAVPGPAGAAPSAIDVDATLVHARDVLTHVSTTICTCDTAACARAPRAEYDLWTTELGLLQHRRGFEDYVKAVAGDATIAMLRDEIDTCTTVLAARPWAATCQRRLARAAGAFARAAPRVVPAFRALDLRARPLRDGAIAGMQIVPGRTWDLRAVIGAPSIVRALGVDPDGIGDDWTMLPTELGVAAVRRIGGFAAVLEIRSERWGDDEPARHPLATLFFQTLRAAASACVQPSR